MIKRQNIPKVFLKLFQILQRVKLIHGKMRDGTDGHHSGIRAIGEHTAVLSPVCICNRCFYLYDWLRQVITTAFCSAEEHLPNPVNIRLLAFFHHSGVFIFLADPILCDIAGNRVLPRNDDNVLLINIIGGKDCPHLSNRCPFQVYQLFKRLITVRTEHQSAGVAVRCHLPYIEFEAFKCTQIKVLRIFYS